jgi:iron complex transport system substrate-binding protein
VLRSPNTYDTPDARIISEEIRIIGKVFGKEAKADNLAKYLEAQIKLVADRTVNIPEDKRAGILFFGLSPRARDDGGAGTISGTDTIESFFAEKIVHAANAFQGGGNLRIVGTEQVLALDPDVIILPTAWGYHPRRELYESPYYKNLRELRAIKNRRVSALPFTPCNCDKRLEYPIDVMVIAKTAYPELFKDIELAEWLLDFYQNVYGVDRNTAKELRSVQWLDWTHDESQ